MRPQTIKVLFRSHYYWAIVSLGIALLPTYRVSRCSAESLKNTTGKLVERVDFDWNHSGKPTRFALSTQAADFDGYPDTLTTQHSGIKPFVLTNKNDGWGRFAVLAPLLKHRNVVSAERMFFIAAGPSPDAR